MPSASTCPGSPFTKTLGDMATVYVELLDEGTICWRPVAATWIGWNHFRLSGPVPKLKCGLFSPVKLLRVALSSFRRRDWVSLRTGVSPNKLLERPA